MRLRILAAAAALSAALASLESAHGEMRTVVFQSVTGVFCLTEHHGKALGEAMLRTEAEGERKLVELESTRWCFRETLLFEIVEVIKTERVATHDGSRTLLIRRGRAFLFTGMMNLFSGESKLAPLPMISISLEKPQ